VDVDADALLAVVVIAGVPPTAECNFPKSLPADATGHSKCTVVNPDGSEGVWTVDYDTSWKLIGQPAYTETKAAPYNRDTCTETPPEGQFQKDSSDSLGRCLHFWADVFQFDANTGPCTFLGHYGSAPHNRNYQFSDAIIRVDGGVRCNLLDPVVEDSLVEVWAVNAGIESYNTTFGGTNTYTVFQLVDIVAYR
jgi:hypothetical protein